MLATERRQLGDPSRIIVETRQDCSRLDARIEPGLRNIHSTNDLHHGNLPCSCDRDPATARSCVTTAKIPGSPTVVAGGVSGDIAARFRRWPPVKALSRFHRTFCSMGRYKRVIEDAIDQAPRCGQTCPAPLFPQRLQHSHIRLKRAAMSDSLSWQIAEDRAMDFRWGGSATAAWKKGGLSSGPAGRSGRARTCGAAARRLAVRERSG